MKPTVSLAAFAVAGMASIAMSGCQIINQVLGTLDPSDRNWHRHYQVAEKALEHSDYETAYREADNIVRIAQASDYVMPKVPAAGSYDRTFDNCMTSLATSFKCMPAKCMAGSGDSGLAGLFMQGQIKVEKGKDLGYAVKLLRTSLIYDEKCHVPKSISNAQRLELADCLKDAGKDAEYQIVLKEAEQSLAEQENSPNPWKRIDVWTAQSRVLERAGRLTEAEEKLKAAVDESDKLDERSPEKLKAMREANANSSAISSPWIVLRLQNLADFYDTTKQIDKERATLLKMEAIDKQIMPDKCFVLVQLRERLRMLPPPPAKQ